MSEEPKKIGKYHVHSVAGSGNFGVVYAGYDPFTAKQVAVKVCSADAQAADGSARLFRKMFFNEAHMAGALDHPNILKVLDAGEEAGEPLPVTGDESIFKLFAKTLDCLNISINVCWLLCRPTASERETRQQK